MSGGGSGGGTSQTTTKLPGWETGAQKSYLSQLQGLVDPNGQLAAYPQSLNQQVAPFTSQQNQAINMGTNLTGGAQGLANLGAGANAYYASGMANNPSTNPNLQAYYNAAAGPYVQQYQQATQPGIMAQQEQAGVLNSSGTNQAMSNAQYNLGQGLATLGANIYEPAYQLGTQEQMSAIQGTPAQVQGLYAPTQALYGIGSAGQQQQQNVLNAQTANAGQAVNWPFNLLSQLGAGLTTAAGGGGVTTSTTQPASGK